MNEFEFKNYLSSYLAADRVDDLFESIKSFPDNIDKVYATETRNYFLQGDCVDNLPISRFFEREDGKLDCSINFCKAVILNNSCDISEERKGGRKVNLFYSPLLSLKKYCDLLQANNDNFFKININDIKKQKYSHIMYFPPFQNEEEDYIIKFDNIFCCDYDLARKSIKRRIFSLSNYGFYSLILKMSVHFLRIREREDRDTVV